MNMRPLMVVLLTPVVANAASINDMSMVDSATREVLQKIAEQRSKFCARLSGERKLRCLFIPQAYQYEYTLREAYRRQVK